MATPRRARIAGDDPFGEFLSQLLQSPIHGIHLIINTWHSGWRLAFHLSRMIGGFRPIESIIQIGASDVQVPLLDIDDSIMGNDFLLDLDGSRASDSPAYPNAVGERSLNRTLTILLHCRFLDLLLKGDSMLRRQSEKEQFWRWVLSEYSQSGLSARQFCHQEGLAEGSFYSWKKKIAQRDQLSQSGGNNLVPVRVLPVADSIQSKLSQSELSPGRTVSMSQGPACDPDLPRSVHPDSPPITGSPDRGFTDHQQPAEPRQPAQYMEQSSELHPHARPLSYSQPRSLVHVPHPDDEIQVITPTGLTLRVGQACSPAFIRRTLLAIGCVTDGSSNGEASC